MQFALQFQRASGGAFCDDGNGVTTAILRGRNGPQRNQRVARELDDVPTPVFDDIDDAAEVEIKYLREMLGASRPLRREALGELGESGDIGKQQRGLKLLRDRFAASQASIVGTLDNQLRQITR